MKPKIYEYDAAIASSGDNGGAYVPFPYDIRQEFGRGSLPVTATFDDVPYEGRIVNMGVRAPDGSICYIIGIRKDIRTRLGKGPGDTVHVTIRQRAPQQKTV